MAALETERRELTEDVKQSKRALEDHMRSSEEVKRELKEQLRVAEENGKEACELREFFEHESGDLKALKLDLQRVLQYVRVRNREVTD
ncbi:hypothetical protein DQ04_02171010 [Trypanosoma grayi]|uniref:hypothetical protein n=1 Tax=Trypanosoma grayi TaxID=71804 RepID=UPI0004F49DF5|nr:hypothetical protein DQ04_02171010 [Trypanosoma grayi]KEG11894.1 hypothetical protein DQ04_02171010 [Trypanosoma grayi]